VVESCLENLGLFPRTGKGKREKRRGEKRAYQNNFHSTTILK
jgi:hypothetical protein